MVQKYRFEKERHIKQTNDIWEWQKTTAEFGGKKVTGPRRIRVTTQGSKEEEVGTLLLGNDQNNVIAKYLFIKLFI